jgi:hypothetical protein
MEALVRVAKDEGVKFSDGVYSEKCWRLYQALQFLAPAVVAASGLPVSLYGIGSFKVVKLGLSGRKRFRMRFSNVLSSVLDGLGDGVSEGSFIEKFQKIFKCFSYEKKDASLQEAEFRLTVDRY